MGLPRSAVCTTLEASSTVFSCSASRCLPFGARENFRLRSRLLTKYVALCVSQPDDAELGRRSRSDDCTSSTLVTSLPHDESLDAAVWEASHWRCSSCGDVGGGGLDIDPGCTCTTVDAVETQDASGFSDETCEEEAP